MIFIYFRMMFNNCQLMFYDLLLVLTDFHFDVHGFLLVVNHCHGCSIDFLLMSIDFQMNPPRTCASRRVEALTKLQSLQSLKLPNQSPRRSGSEGRSFGWRPPAPLDAPKYASGLAPNRKRPLQAPTYTHHISKVTPK